MNILSIIPARSGSLEVKNKNIQVVGNLTLLEHAIKVAQKVTSNDKIIVSSDSVDYLNIANKFSTGLILSKRSTDLSTANSSIIDVIEAELLKYKKIEEIEYILLLEPSHFGRRANVKKIEKRLESENFDFALGVYEVPMKYHLEKQIKVDDKLKFKSAATTAKNRQDLSKTFIRSGEFYLFRPSLFMESRNMFQGNGRVFITSHASVNIDTIEDLNDARQIEFLEE